MARPKLPADQVRHRRDVWMSAAEWAAVCEAAAAAAQPVRAYCRRVLLGKRIAAAPSVETRKAWVELARVHANLNQVAHALNGAVKAGMKRTPELREIAELLRECDAQTKALRAELLSGGDDS